MATVLDRERAGQLVEHRSRIGKPLTFSAAEKLAAKLAGWHSPGEAADAMLANGWQGFEPAWMERRTAAASRTPAGGSGGDLISGHLPSSNARALNELDRQLAAAGAINHDPSKMIDGHARRR